MHSFTLVLIPADTQDVRTTVGALLEAFEDEKQVEAYKAYVTGKVLHRMAKRYGLLEIDLPALVPHVKRYFGAQEGGIDEGGLFYISTSNPQGTWDYWVIGGRWDGVVQGTSYTAGGGDSLQKNVCPVSELPDGIGAAFFITPDGQLYKEDGQLESDAGQSQWPRTFHALLERYRDCLAVSVDCHS